MGTAGPDSLRGVAARALALLAVVIAVAGGAIAAAADDAPRRTAKGHSAVPHYKHVVVAIFENHEQSQIVGADNAPYFTSLAGRSANFTQSYGIEHPSQPNYLDLFSGSNQGVQGDACPNTYDGNNLANQLIKKGKRFIGYSQGLPNAGSKACTHGRYARKHSPWTNFSNLKQRDVSKPYSAFPKKFRKLPRMSWVIPDLCNDMHDCSVPTGDAWAKKRLNPYAKWARKHDSLLVVTFDEDDYLGLNRIATIFAGAHIKTGSYGEHITHFTVLKTLERMNGLKGIGGAKGVAPITDVFK